MSELAKGKFEVLRILRGSVLKALSLFGCSHIQCMEFAQPLLTSANNVVLLQNTTRVRVGWQWSTYNWVNSTPQGRAKLEHNEVYIEQQAWNLITILKRTTKEVNANTLTAEDVANNLIAWFNGQAIYDLRKNNCANLYVQPSEIHPYKDDSGVYQYTASFTLPLQVPKALTFAQETAQPNYKGSYGFK